MGLRHVPEKLLHSAGQSSDSGDQEEEPDRSGKLFNGTLVVEGDQG